jgi:uroporphyrinogen decarboxylase
MTSRERILATLRRDATDRPAADIWTTPEIMQDLKHHFGVETERDVYQHLGVDKIAWVRAPHLDTHEAGPQRTDEWGVAHQWVRFGAGYYEEVAHHPLEGVEDVGALSDYPWPDPERYDVAALEHSVSAQSQWVRMLPFISIFEVYCALKPMDEALMDLYLNPDFAHGVIERIMTVQRGYLRRALEAVGENIDIVYLSDDMGMQDRPLMSLDMWRQFFRDPYAELISTVHDSGHYAFYHTDGSAFDIVAELVELGINVLNPIQHRCPGMERERLFDAFGDRVIFHGAVENQEVLPFGTPEDVRAEVRENIRTLGADGGYIVGPCHMIQAGTPVANIVAMYEAAREAT